MRVSYPGLGAIGMRVRSAGRVADRDRRAALDAILRDTLPEALEVLSTAAFVADRACDGSKFADIAILLEDAIYPNIEVMGTARDSASLAAAASLSTVAIRTTIASLNAAITGSRQRYRRLHRRRTASI